MVEKAITPPATSGNMTNGRIGSIRRLGRLGAVEVSSSPLEPSPAQRERDTGETSGALVWKPLRCGTRGVPASVPGLGRAAPRVRAGGPSGVKP